MIFRLTLKSKCEALGYDLQTAFRNAKLERPVYAYPLRQVSNRMRNQNSVLNRGDHCMNRNTLPDYSSKQYPKIIYRLDLKKRGAHQLNF